MRSKGIIKDESNFWIIKCTEKCVPLSFGSRSVCKRTRNDSGSKDDLESEETSQRREEEAPVVSPTMADPGRRTDRRY